MNKVIVQKLDRNNEINPDFEYYENLDIWGYMCGTKPEELELYYAKTTNSAIVQVLYDFKNYIKANPSAPLFSTWIQLLENNMKRSVEHYDQLDPLLKQLVTLKASKEGCGLIFDTTDVPGELISPFSLINPYSIFMAVKKEEKIAVGNIFKNCLRQDAQGYSHPVFTIYKNEDPLCCFQYDDEFITIFGFGGEHNQMPLLDNVDALFIKKNLDFFRQYHYSVVGHIKPPETYITLGHEEIDLEEIIVDHRINVCKLVPITEKKGNKSP